MNLETGWLNGRRFAAGLVAAAQWAVWIADANRPLLTVLVTFEVAMPFR
jgi:hypothetical protein